MSWIEFIVGIAPSVATVLAAWINYRAGQASEEGRHNDCPECGDARHARSISR
jgi:hypothetical protein